MGDTTPNWGMDDCSEMGYVFCKEKSMKKRPFLREFQLITFTAAVRKIPLLALFVVLGPALSAVEYKDVVHLKNGSIVKGTIVENVPGDYIKIETSDGSIFVFKMREIAKFMKEKAETTRYAGSPVSPDAAAQYETQKKLPAVGVLLSGFLLPGSGHLYAGEIGWGLGYLALESGLFVSALTVGYSSYTYAGNAYSGSYNYTRVNGYFYVALITLGVLHVIDTIHAYFSVEGYNRNLRRKLGIPEYYSQNVNIRFFATNDQYSRNSFLGSSTGTQYGMSFGISF